MKKNSNKTMPGSANWIWWLSFRYIKPVRKEKKQTLYTFVVIGLILGVTAQILVVGVMNGLQSGKIEVYNDLASYHLRVHFSDNSKTLSNYQYIKEFKSQTPYIESLSLIKEGEGLVKSLESDRAPQAVQIRALEASDFEWIKAKLKNFSVVSPNSSLDLSGSNDVIIGQSLARALRVGVGKPIDLLTIDQSNGGIRTDPLVVRATVDFDFSDFNKIWIFVPITNSFVRDAEGPLQYAFRFDTAEREAQARVELSNYLKSRGIDLSAISFENYKSFNRSLFGALRVEKSFIFILIALIFIVVAINLFHGMRVSVAEKSLDLAILRSLGSNPRQLRRVFMLQGLVLGAIGGLIGLLVGLIVTGFLNPISSFFASIFGQSEGGLIEWPVTLYPGEVILSFVLAPLSALVASYFASKSISKKSPAEILRHN